MSLDPCALTRALIEIPSPTGHESRVTDFVARWLERGNWTVVRQEVTPGRHNIYAHHGSPRVVLSTHLDTVPPELPVRDDATTIHGRGSCDAKGIAAAAELHDAGEDRVGLLLVVGEEDGSDGARAAATLLPKGQFLINGEPTENRLVTAQKGTLKVLLDARGRAAHSGYPHLGDSAIAHLLAALDRVGRLDLPVDPELGPTTVNIGRMHGGVAANVIPPEAHAELLVRIVGEEDRVREMIAGAVGDDATVTFVAGIPPARAPAIAGWPSTTVSFASDLAFHGAWGKCYQIGPGSIHVAHTDHEYIDKADLRLGVTRYIELVRTLMNHGR